MILSPKHYDLLPEPDDEENDMLDLAFGLEDTSVVLLFAPLLPLPLACSIQLSAPHLDIFSQHVQTHNDDPAIEVALLRFELTGADRD